MAAPCDLEGASYDRTDPGGTYRPNLPPAQKKGKKFVPLTMANREPAVRDLPDTALEIFQRFVPESLVKSWANSTNEAAAGLVRPETKPSSRKHRWRDTSAAEIYVFIGIVICMENQPEKSIKTYWTTGGDGGDGQTFYFFTRLMPLARFELLWRHLHIFDDACLSSEAVHVPSKLAASKSYQQVNEWSRHIQDEMARIYVPGTLVAVDECMQGFTGRSDLKTHIPNKPTPDGIKIWVVAQDGIFLRWLWHEPGKGPVGIPTERQLGRKDLHLTPTQRVVIALLKLLPNTSYHVFLDNLFTSPDLFKYLYDIGIGASGTARMNCGIHEDLVAVKKHPDPSYHWGWTLQIPTECEKVFPRRFYIKIP